MNAFCSPERPTPAQSLQWGLFYTVHEQTGICLSFLKDMRHWGCENLISSRDPHEVCSNCLGLKHGHHAVDNSGSSQLCLVFMLKSLSRQLICQVNHQSLAPIRHPGTVDERGQGTQLQLLHQPLPAGAPSSSCPWTPWDILISTVARITPASSPTSPVYAQHV